MQDREQVRGMLNRLMLSEEGPDFLDYLKDLSEDNYKSFKTDTQEMNEIHKGYAIAIDSLIMALETSVKPIEPTEANFG